MDHLPMVGSWRKSSIPHLVIPQGNYSDSVGERKDAGFGRGFWREFTMKRCAVWMAGLIVAAAGSVAVSDAAGQEDASRQFVGIREQLGSDDFAAREAGQRALEKIPREQVEGLRKLAQQEKDPEIKARLEVQVRRLDEWMLHPSGLSVDFKAATFDQIVKELNRQLGGDYVERAGADGPAYTLKAENRPFWEIVDLLNQQSPVGFNNVPVYLAGTLSFPLKISPRAGAAQTQITVKDGIGYLPVVNGGALSVTMVADPRMRVIQYSPVKVDVILDQDGNSLLPRIARIENVMTSPARKSSIWPGGTILRATPGITRIKLLQGSMAVTLVEHEQTARVDLNKPEELHQPPLQVDVSNGELKMLMPATSMLAGVPAASETGNDVRDNERKERIVVFRIVDKGGNALRTEAMVRTWTGEGATVQTGLPKDAAAVEQTWPDKVRTIVVPVELRDVDLGAK
jgi:hypothetical protein